MHEPEPDKPRRTRAVFDLPAWGLGAFTLAGFAGSWHWLLDLTSHFRWYYLLVALGWYAVTSRRRSHLATACLAIAVVVNAGMIAPYWLPTEHAAGDGDRLEIVSLNLHLDKGDKERTLAYFRQRNPDVVVLFEVDDAWAAALRGLESLYPYSFVVPQQGSNFGLAVYSKWPLDQPHMVRPGDGPPVIIAGLPHGEQGCLLVAVHPPAPVRAAWSARRDAQLRAIGEIAASERRPVIIAGDFNATPWCHGFRLVTKPRRLRDTAIGRGLQATWNAHLWAPRIPIDHVLVSPEIGVRARTVGPDVGSDHLPVEASLVVP